MNPNVDLYLKDGCGRCKYYQTPQCKVHNWIEELEYLRIIANDLGLTEELKWSVPCYTVEGKNIFIIAAFKDFCAISFFKGSLLKDTKQLLSSPGDNSQSGRYFKFTSLKEIQKQENNIRNYIQEAIDNELNGKKVDFKKPNDIVMPEELIEALEKDTSFNMAFHALTPGRQRGWVLHYSGAKQSATRISRIEKSKEKVLKGLGWNE